MIAGMAVVFSSVSVVANSLRLRKTNIQFCIYLNFSTMETLKFKTTINCGGCVKAVTPHLNQVESIESWQVDTLNPDKILEVQSKTGNQQLVIEAVERAGFKATPVVQNAG